MTGELLALGAKIARIDRQISELVADEEAE